MFTRLRDKLLHYRQITGDIPSSGIEIQGKLSFIHRWIYRLNFILLLHLTPLSRGLMVAFSLYFLLVLIAPSSSLLTYAIIFLVLYCIFDFLGGVLFRPKIKLLRTLPAQCIAHQSFEMHYQMQNQRSLPAFQLLLDNYRFPCLKKTDGGILYTCLPGKSQASVSISALITKRGLHTLPQTYISSAFPFGIIQRGLFGQGTQQILVLPPCINVSHLDLPPSSARARHTEEAHSHSGGDNMLEYSKIREYRPGDSPRLIHWPTYARLGEPVIVEFSDNTQPEVSLYLDLKYKAPARLSSAKNVNDFEAAVIIATSMLRHCISNNYHIRNFLCGADLLSFDSRQSPQEIIHTCLQKLAQVQACKKETPEELISIKQTLFPLIKQTPFISVFSTLDATRLTLAKQLNDHQNASVIFVSSRHTAKEQDGPDSSIKYMDAKAVIEESQK